MMMMGVGLLVMLLFLLVIVGVPVLIIARAAKGGLQALSKLRSQATGSEAPSPSPRPSPRKTGPAGLECVPVLWGGSDLIPAPLLALAHCPLGPNSQRRVVLLYAVQ